MDLKMFSPEMFEAVGMVAWQLIPGTDQLTYVSASMTSIVGGKMEDWGTLSQWMERVHPDDRAEFMDCRRLREERGSIYNLDYRISSEAGDWVWFHERSFPVFDDDQTCLGITGICVPVTEQKEREDSLVEREARFEALLVSMPVIIWSTDTELNLTYLLGGGLQLTGAEVNNVVGTSLKGILMNDMTSEASSITPMEGHRRALNGVPADYEAQYEKRSFECHIEPLTSRDGTVIGTMGIARDISDLVKVREQFLFAQKMEAVGRLAGGVAHDINNLLTAVMGYVDILKKSLSPDDPLLRHVEAIGRASHRGDTMISKLMAYGRKQVPNPEKLDIGKQVAELEDFVGRLVSENVVLSVHVGDMTNDACVDAVQLEQVVLNLVVNASDAMPEGGELSLSVSSREVDSRESDVLNLPAAGDYVFVEVSDQGTGIATEIHGQVFEPFFTTKNVGEGTGLGLSTVYAIAQSAGGGISFETTVGEGTRFSVGFPRVDAGGMDTLEEEGSFVGELGNISKNVLLVEDDEMVRTLIRDILSDAGFNVMEAHFGPAALVLSRQLHGTLDLLVTDVIMPQQSGPELAETIREENPGAQVLYISGHSNSEVAEDYGSGVGFLAKPFQPDTLLEKVYLLLGKDEG